MDFDLAIRITEIILALAFMQASAEHLSGPKDRACVKDRWLFVPRIFLCLLLLAGYQTPWVCAGLVALSVLILQRYQGPYNGGSDRMGLLVLSCLTLVHVLPSQLLQELAFGYLGLQLVLSYFMSGWVKIVNADWRNGRALGDVFAFSAYPVSEHVRNWARYPLLLRVMSWAVMGFELIFPLCLLHHAALVAGLLVAASFHLANAFLFGLNRFFWIWLAAYPSILWLQDRLF
ncbi:MAG: hypothetical protein CMH27_07975 [Micavibrio sp.]|nr:hypothetical protein [Micavibrio sp.]|tara:strand:- start:527 stop:1222 length:696 start_codon:yes stop_codon:yes gene_type:complete